MWGEIADLVVASDMGRECRFNGVMDAVPRAMHVGNADLTGGKRCADDAPDELWRAIWGGNADLTVLWMPCHGRSMEVMPT